MRLSDADVVFVVDEGAGPHVAQAVIDAGGQACLLTSHVAPGTEDVEWLPLVHQWGCAVITRDRAMRLRPAEYEAIKNSGVHVFIIRGKNLNFAGLRAITMASYKQMMRFVTTHRTPFIAHVTSNGVSIHETAGRSGGPRKKQALP